MRSGLQKPSDRPLVLIVGRGEREAVTKNVCERLATGHRCLVTGHPLVIFLADYPLFLEDVLNSFGECPLGTQNACITAAANINFSSVPPSIYGPEHPPFPSLVARFAKFKS
jgi:hypothetical protein